MKTIQSSEIIAWFKGLQNDICRDLELIDGKAKFQEDLWERPGGGGGRTRVIKGGKVIEKGGVNFSLVEGQLSEPMSKALKVNAADTFKATGVSIVLHPKSPMVPIIHMNVRYFELSSGEYWFGGGIDLTPHYVDKEAAKLFHSHLFDACENSKFGYYERFKKWADDYFFIPHREETRGIGGIFFDRLHHEKEGLNPDQLWHFVQDVGESFIPAYKEQVLRAKDKDFGKQELLWQRLRRGRYAEFNLVWDRGTKFGLESNGRTESILMSLPPEANWEYDHQVKEGSKEEETLSLLKKGINWLG
ncbi:oxygen-dependent coproporphyrinogen oxidase [Flammeovirga kamogawensis]|uniref:coproporphyrinogen oxidase n=1 Tax=Flammeovirga kamogawensis TaxID=373891 RepID=A0ABX8GW79_9BACT|nr:oxygen-dependent coproporphyrinogen oxidase [Flammeovirga kamogawensis]MBB6459736.1 coproporphyrinogen III oxidase [Flammeovirga kamogawensis]QWG07205.1 oxygen-dependent coproporphyrinogen oxidase [Flammeovirga kamogawensis]TRX69025.1 oxygen-dependent coproporphyrinogen oxidase [Flammeovirga kamogawensis]